MADRKMKLLVVEDMEEARELIRFYFERKGFVVLAAASGEDALPLIKEENPDIMLLDIDLPCMSGIDLLRLVRQSNSSLKVIMVTSSVAGFHENEQLKELNFSEYITKPVTFFELESSVRQVLTAS